MRNVSRKNEANCNETRKNDKQEISKISANDGMFTPIDWMWEKNTGKYEYLSWLTKGSNHYWSCEYDGKGGRKQIKE
jgi:hypothetical protein